MALAGLLSSPAPALAQEPPPALFEEGTAVEKKPVVEVMVSPGSEMANMEMIEESGGQVLEHGHIGYATMYAASFYVIFMKDPQFPVLVTTVEMQSNVLGLQMKQGRLLAILEDHRVVEYDISDPFHPRATVSTKIPKDMKLFGITAGVQEVEEGRVILDAGEAEGVATGMKFVIYGKRRPLGAPRAIIEITSTTEHTSEATLPPRGSASRGDQAYEADGKWSPRHWFLPDPEPGYFEMAIDLKPIIGARRGAGTVGFLSGLDIGYQFKAPLKLDLVLNPAGFAHSDAGSGAVFELGAMAGLSTRLVGLRGGAGAHISVGHGKNHLLWLNEIRLGSDEGFHLTLFMCWAIPGVYDGARKILPSTALATLDIPLVPRLGLYVEFGGGNLALGEDEARGSGWANFVGGVRTLVRGQSGSGSVVLSTGVGFGYVWAQTPFNRFTKHGGHTTGLLLHVGIGWKK